MSAVSERYARALFDALSVDARTSAGMEQLEAISAVLSGHPDARQLLINPAFPPERRETFLDDLGRVLGLDSRVRRLLGLLVDRRRLELLDEIIEGFRRREDQKNGVVRAAVTTAAPMADADRERVNRRLEQALGKRVLMSVADDPALLGGVMVQVGSTVYDGSLRQYLSGVRDRLLAG